MLVHVTSWPYLDGETTQRSGAVVAKSHHQGGRAWREAAACMAWMAWGITYHPRFIIQIYPAW